MPPFAGFWARIAILQSTLSISVPAANGFLPHQNVDYVVVALAIAGGLILLAPVVLTLVKKTLLDDLDAPRIEVVQPHQKVPRSRSETTAIVIGMLAALAVIAGSRSFPSRCSTRPPSEHRKSQHSASLLRIWQTR